MKTKKIALVSASALTAGLAHGQIVTNSQIIYTYANVTLPTGGVGYPMDLNQDGSPDFQIHFNSNNANKPLLDTSSYLTQPNLTPSVLAGSGDGLPVTTNGTPIDGAYESPEEYGYFYQDGSANAQGSWNSNGTNIQGYVGLTLQDSTSGDYYYGWAQFVYNSTTVFDGTAGEITLIDFAFDQNPGETILAGESAPPGSAPKIVVSPASHTNGVLTTVQFKVIAAGNPYPTCQWLAATNGSTTYTPLADGGPISGSQSNVLTIANSVPGFSGNYIVDVQNTSGSTATVPATLTIAPLAITNMTPASLTVFPGGKASIYPGYSTASPILSFQWLKNGAILNSGGRVSGTTSSNLVITALAASDSANYSVIVSNTFGAVTSAVVAVSVTLPSSPYEQQVLWTEPVSYYALNETNDPVSGTVVALDYIEGANGLYGSGTQNGNPKYGVAGPNPAAGFPGFAATNTAVAITNSTKQLSYLVSLPPLNLFSNVVTFTMWINPAQTELAYAVLNSYRSSVSGTANGINYWGPPLAPTGTTSTTLGYHWTDNEYNWNSTLTVPIQEWSFVALVITETNGVEYVFNNDNGMVVATNAATNAVAAINTPGFLGGDLNDNNFIGSIDEVAIFNQPLSQTQLTNLWVAATSGQVTPPPAPPILTIQLSSGNVIISWNPPVGMLLQAPSLSGPWTTNNGASSPYTNAATGSAQFYRVLDQ